MDIKRLTFQSCKITLKKMSQHPLLQLSGIKKKFNNTEILKGLDLSVGSGEFVTLLGSSGCGKTTTLRIIAGLESADSGTVLIDGRDVTSLEPDKRGVNMVFQNYALFPHMNVEQNIGYSLKIKRVPKELINEEVGKALSLVRLSGFEKRKPDQLSGGERQRVAVARSVINKPKVLLLDEPLGALDLQLRRQMQHELKQLQKQLGLTFIYITHDQEEALAMSDTIAVMRDGLIEQAGSAKEIYSKPKSAYTAKFVGNANILCGKVKTVSNLSSENGGKIRISFTHSAGSAEIDINENEINRNIQAGMQIMTAVREENITYLPLSHNGLSAVITEKSFSSGLLRISALLDNCTEEVKSSIQGIESDLKTGDRVSVSWKPETAVLLERE